MANPQRRTKKPETSPEQAIVEGVVRGIGSLFSLLFRPGTTVSKGLSASVRLELANHWKGVETHLLNPATHMVAVTEADKVFDATLQALAVRGKNMGERLIAAKTMFSAELYQQLWEAHTLRNRLAHEVGASLGAPQAHSATGTFRRALRELGIPV